MSESARHTIPRRLTATPEIAVGLSGAGRDYSLGWPLPGGPCEPAAAHRSIGSDDHRAKD